MQRPIQFFLLLVGTSLAAAAHSEEVLFIPVGQIAGLILSIAVAIVLRKRLFLALALLAIAVLVAFATWFTPASLQQAWDHAFGKNPGSYFALGFLPPATVAAGAFFRGKRKVRQPEKTSSRS